jgi:hypothetical protein
VLIQSMILALLRGPLLVEVVSSATARSYLQSFAAEEDAEDVCGGMRWHHHR